MTLSRLLEHSRLSAMDASRQIRELLELKNGEEFFENQSRSASLVHRYLKYRGLYLERLIALRETRAHRPPRFAERPKWTISPNEMRSFLNEAKIDGPVGLWPFILGETTEFFPDLNSELSTTEDLEVFLSGFVNYCDLIATDSAWVELFPQSEPSRETIEFFRDYERPPVGRYAETAGFHCRQFVLSERLYPWRKTYLETSVRQRYRLACIQANFDNSDEDVDTRGVSTLEQISLDVDEAVQSDFDRMI